MRWRLIQRVSPLTDKLLFYVRPSTFVREKTIQFIIVPAKKAIGVIARCFLDFGSKRFHSVATRLCLMLKLRQPCSKLMP